MSEIEVVAGEMAQFSDFSHGSCGSPLWQEILKATPNVGGYALVVGSVDIETISVLLGRFGHVTCVFRSLPDAEAVQQMVEDNRLPVTVVAGSIEAWSAENARVFDAIIAIDGLDRTQGADLEYLTWLRRLSLVAQHLRASGRLFLTLTNQFSIGNILDARPQHARHQDDEWVPQQSGPSRPTAIPEYLEALAAAELPASHLFAGYGDYRDPGALVDVTRLGKMRYHHSLAAAIGHSIAAVDRPWLSDPREPWLQAVRALESETVADFWLLVSGSVPLCQVYLRAAGLQDVEDGHTAQARILRYAEMGDVPGLREYAAKIGEWARSGVNVRRFDQLVETETGFGPGYCSQKADVAWNVALAALWIGIRDLLISGNYRHPWPSWMITDGLVESWLAAGNCEVSDSEMELAARLAKEWAGPVVYSVRAELAQVQVAHNREREALGLVDSLQERLEMKIQEYDEETERLNRRIKQLSVVRAVVNRIRRLLGGGKKK